LQEFERSLHDSRLPGAEIAIPSVQWMQKQVADQSGELFVAEADGVFQGFVTSWVNRKNYIIEKPDSNAFGFISDICVMRDWRGRGIGWFRQLRRT
jgi:ribosomal protein S18 acetylase RimI-like enzyme